MPRQADQRRDPRSHANVDDLLTAAGLGDVNALGALYDRTAPVVFGLLRGVSGDPTWAAEATERVYLSLWRAAPRFDPAAEDAYALVLRAARRELVDPLPGAEASTR